ncbi:MAG: D-lyxose/D-mannose family sugar isomerase [Planctomycetota bacterium]|jgi:D-lyxose ketol-isomerase
MKRSEINAHIRDAEAFFAEHRFFLPPFGGWTPDEWKSKGREADEIRTNSLGWDLTDFGSGDFEKVGLLLFTVRNGSLGDPEAKKYCEKIMILRDGQVCPWHFHWDKVEDIINRGGGKLVIDLAKASDDEASLTEEAFVTSLDGVERKFEGRSRVVLEPGESITLEKHVYHTFTGDGKVLVGEVSSVNDDAKDNRFLEPAGRFPTIEEDEPPYRLLCTEYPKPE